MILAESVIKELGLVTDYRDWHRQSQPNGFDVTLDEIVAFEDEGAIYIDRKTLPIYQPQQFNPFNMVHLRPGCYLVKMTEAVRLTEHIVCQFWPRSTFIRSGASFEAGHWDIGYHGKGSVLLVVHNPYGITLERYCSIGQLVFFDVRSAGENKLYNGSYQRENI